MLLMFMQLQLHLHVYLMANLVSVLRKWGLRGIYLEGKHSSCNDCVVVIMSCFLVCYILWALDVLYFGSRCLQFSLLFFGLFSALDVLYFRIIHMHTLFCNDICTLCAWLCYKYVCLSKDDLVNPIFIKIWI